MIKTIRFILGYIIGTVIFLFLIPYGFFELSRLDYLFNYQMLINGMVLRFVVSGILIIIGFVFMIWSNISLLSIGKGGPAEGFGISISPRTTNLVTRGPYKLCRNPMVFSALCLYLGLIIYLNSISGLIILIALFSLGILYLKSFEEKRLIKDFGAQYKDYMSHVSMIFPFKRFH